MDRDGIIAEFTLSQALLGGSSPAGASISVRVTAGGMYDAGGLGYVGQEPRALEPERVATLLKESFGVDDVRAILDRLAQVRAAL